MSFRKVGISNSNKNVELPQGWVVKHSVIRKRSYYFNVNTGVSSWNMPEESSRSSNRLFEVDANRDGRPQVKRRALESSQQVSILPGCSAQVTPQKSTLDCSTSSTSTNNAVMKVKFTLKQQVSLKKPSDIFNITKSGNESTGNDKCHEVAVGKVMKRKKKKESATTVEVNLTRETAKTNESNNKSLVPINSYRDSLLKNTLHGNSSVSYGFNLSQKGKSPITSKTNAERDFHHDKGSVSYASNLSQKEKSVTSKMNAERDFHHDRGSVSYGYNLSQKEKSSIISKINSERNFHYEHEKPTISKVMAKKDLNFHHGKSSSIPHSEITKNRRNLSQLELIRMYDITHTDKCKLEREHKCHTVTTNKTYNSCKMGYNLPEERISTIQRPGIVSYTRSKNTDSVSSSSRSVASCSDVGRQASKDYGKEEIDMEWEAIDDEKVLLNIQEHRQHCHGMGISYIDSPPEDMEVNYFDLSSDETEDCIVVLDTNILISHLKFVQQLSENGLKGLGRPILVIPWMVLKELDAMKTGSKNEKVKTSARVANQFINRCFTSRHPYVKGQSAMDDKEECFKVEVPDDNILNCCLQLVNKGKQAILLSNDVNLCNKAIANGVQSYGKDQLNKAITNGDITPLSNAVKEIIQQRHDSVKEMPLPKVPAKQYEKPTKRMVYRKFHTLLNEFLSKILQAEMKRAFEDKWIKVIFIKPPWTLVDILRCIIKHWCAVFSFIMDNMAKNTIEILINYFKRQVSGPALCEIYNIVESGISLCRAINSKEYRELVSEYSHYFEALVRNDQDDQTNDNPLVNPVVVDPSASFSVPNLNISSEEAGKTAVFEAFQMALSLVNSFCGILCDIIGVNHPIMYQRPEVFPSLEETKGKLPNVSGCLGNLIKSMYSVLETPISCLSSQHQAVLSLHASLRALLPSDNPIYSAISCERLFSFAVEANTRTMLCNGFKQFTELQMLLSKVISYIVELK